MMPSWSSEICNSAAEHSMPRLSTPPMVPIRIGVLFGGDHPRDGERRQRFRLVVDVLDLKPDHGELVGEFLNGLVGVEMFLQPGEREFHDDRFPAGTSCSLSRLRGRVRVGVLASIVGVLMPMLTNSPPPPASGRRAA